jgi:ferredoxin
VALSIEQDTCIGCGVCASMLETVFEMNDDEGIAVVKDAGSASEDEIQEAIDACPVGCIVK